MKDNQLEPLIYKPAMDHLKKINPLLSKPFFSNNKLKPKNFIRRGSFLESEGIRGTPCFENFINKQELN